jgi:hypothetical protein
VILDDLKIYLNIQLFKKKISLLLKLLLILFLPNLIFMDFLFDAFISPGCACLSTVTNRATERALRRNED